MNYKALILKMLEQLDENYDKKYMENAYWFFRGMLGDDWEGKKEK